MLQFPDLDQQDVEWLDFEWFYRLVEPWRPGRSVAVNELARPTAPNGFVLLCSTAGMTHGREPAWPATADDTKADGSAIWTMKKPADASIPTIASCTYAITPSGELVEDDTGIDNTRFISRIRVDPTGAEPGEYEIEATMTDSNGEDHVVTAGLRIVRAG